MCHSLWGLFPNQEIPQVIRRLLTTQQAFPKSAILTLMLSALSGSRGLTSRDPAVGLPIRAGERQRANKRGAEWSVPIPPCSAIIVWFSGRSLVTWCISFGWLTIQRILRCVPTVVSILPLSLVHAVLQLSLLHLGGKESPIAATPACTAFLCIVVPLVHISSAVAGWVNRRLIVPLLLAGLCVAIVLVFVPPLGGPLVRCYMAVTVHLRWFFWSCAFDPCVLTAL